VGKLTKPSPRRFDLNHILTFFLGGLVSLGAHIFLRLARVCRAADTQFLAGRRQSAEPFCELRFDRAGLGDLLMRAASLREKAADYLRLARGLSAHSPTRRHLLVMAERLERQAEDLDKEFVDAAAPERPVEAGSSESDNPER